MVQPQNLDDPRRTLVSLLESSWNSSNTPDVGASGTPNFATSWIDQVDDERPLVTVTNRNDQPTAASGYSSIQGDGSGVNARKLGFVFVNCWARDRDPEDVGTQPNPKDEAEQMWQEVERIVLANAVGTGNLEFLRTDGPMEGDDQEVETASDVLTRLHGRIEYQYTLTPA